MITRFYKNHLFPHRNHLIYLEKFSILLYYDGDDNEANVQSEHDDEEPPETSCKKNIRFNEACLINEFEIPIAADSLQQPAYKKLDGEAF